MNAPASGPTIQKVLLADIGGTNARFALLAGRTVGTIAHMAVRDFGSFREALGAYLGGVPEAGAIGAVILAASGAVQNGRCALTNNPWVIDAAELRATFGFSTVRLINDFEAVAWSLPRLSGDKLLQVGSGKPVDGRPLAALGPGTGLGMAVSIPHGTGHLVLSSEGGHSTMAGSSLREDAVIAYLRRRFGHVSAERVLSGNGLETLYEALAALDNLMPPSRRDCPGRDRGYLSDEPRRHRYVLRDAWDCRRQSRAHARREGRNICRRRHSASHTRIFCWLRISCAF